MVLRFLSVRPTTSDVSQLGPMLDAMSVFVYLCLVGRVKMLGKGVAGVAEVRGMVLPVRRCEAKRVTSSANRNHTRPALYSRLTEWVNRDEVRLQSGPRPGFESSGACVEHGSKESG